MRVLFPYGAFLWRLRAVLAVSGSFAYYVCACACPHGFAWLSVRCVGARVLSSISLGQNLFENGVVWLLKS